MSFQENKSRPDYSESTEKRGWLEGDSARRQEIVSRT